MFRPLLACDPGSSASRSHAAFFAMATSAGSRGEGGGGNQPAAAWGLPEEGTAPVNASFNSDLAGDSSLPSSDFMLAEWPRYGRPRSTGFCAPDFTGVACFTTAAVSSLVDAALFSTLSSLLGRCKVGFARFKPMESLTLSIADFV